MKYMKTIDFVGQTLILTAYVIGSIWLVAAEERWGSLAMTTAYAMLCIGWWQMVSALIMLATQPPFKKQRLIHFSTSLIYLVLLALGAKYFEMKTVPSIIKWISWIIIIATPVLLAFFYYSITWRSIFPTSTSGKFLRHISF